MCYNRWMDAQAGLNRAQVGLNRAQAEVNRAQVEVNRAQAQVAAVEEQTFQDVLQAQVGPDIIQAVNGIPERPWTCRSCGRVTEDSLQVHRGYCEAVTTAEAGSEHIDNLFPSAFDRLEFTGYWNEEF